jgi:hypothetical protein
VTATPDHHDHYTPGERLAPLAGVERCFCTEITLGARLIFHSLHAGEMAPRRSEIERQFRLWGGVRHPRLPLLVDAWYHDGHVEWVTTSEDGDPLGSPEGMGPIGRSPSFGVTVSPEEEIGWQTLDALAALHEQGISHRALRREAYCVTRSGMVFLWEWALCARMAQIIADPPGGMRFELSTNLLGRDVADWGLMMAELVTGSQFTDHGPVGEPPTLDPSPDTLAAAQEAARHRLPKGPFSDFINKAIDGRREAHRGFPNATEARAAFPSLSKVLGVPA